MKERTSNEYLVVIAGVLLSAYYELPAFVSAIKGIGHIFILATVIFLVYCFRKNHTIKTVELLLGVSFVLEFFFYALFGDRFEVGMGYLVQDTIIRYLDIVTVCILLSAINELTENSRKKLLLISISFLLFTVIVTFVYLQLEPEIVRNLVTETTPDGYSKGIANYNIVYGAILIVIPIVQMYRQSRGMHRLLLIGILGLLSFFVFDCAFSIAIIVLIVEVLLLVYYASSENSMRRAFLCIGIGIVSILVVYNIQSILMLLCDLVDSPSFKVRIKEVQLFLLTGQKGGDLSGRINVYSKSLSTIGKSLLMGYSFIINKNGLGVFVGGHSRILDYCAELGILPLIGYLIWLWHKVMDNFSKEDLRRWNDGKILFLVMVILMTLNPMYEGYLLYYGLYYLLLITKSDLNVLTKEDVMR